MPTDDESYKGYRETALVRASEVNETLCTSKYSSCSYTVADIIEMNDMLEVQAGLAKATTKPKASSSTKATVTTAKAVTTTTTEKPAVTNAKNRKKVKAQTRVTTRATTTFTTTSEPLTWEEYGAEADTEAPAAAA